MLDSQTRELIYFFAWRELKVRYKQTAIGILWVVFQPLLFAIIINETILRKSTIAFGPGIPSIIPVYLGLLFWNYFEQSLNQASNSLVNNQPIITKVYFPRYIPSIAATIAPMIDFFVASLLLIPMFFIKSYSPNWAGLLYLIPAVLFVFVFVNFLGLFFATLNVKYRDIKFVIPFMLRILLFTTPVFYPLSFLPLRFQNFAFLNPATAAIESARAVILPGCPMPTTTQFLISFVVILVTALVAVPYFRSQERKFADIA